jgi:hypothetical protein
MQIVGWSHRDASRLISLPLLHEKGTQPDHVSTPRFCMLPAACLFQKTAAVMTRRRNVSTTLIQPGLEFRLGWSGWLCGIELSEAAGFLV